MLVVGYKGMRVVAVQVIPGSFKNNLSKAIVCIEEDFKMKRVVCYREE